MHWLLRNTIISADTQKLITAGMEMLKLIKLWFRNFSQKYILVSISDLLQTWGQFWFKVWVKIESSTVA